jgi:hypothetical protein
MEDMVQKGTVSSVHRMKAYRGSRGIAPLILNLNTPRPLYPQEITPVSLNRRLRGTQSESGRFGEEKISCPCRDSNP